MSLQCKELEMTIQTAF